MDADVNLNRRVLRPTASLVVRRRQGQFKTEDGSCESTPRRRLQWPLVAPSMTFAPTSTPRSSRVRADGKRDKPIPLLTFAIYRRLDDRPFFQLRRIREQ